MSSTPFLLTHSHSSRRRPSHSFRPAPSGPVQSRWPVLLRAWLPVLLFGCVFIIESTPAFGVDRTSLPLRGFLEHFFGNAVDNGWTFTYHYIRKTGHFTGYGLLSLVCFRGFWLTLRSSSRFSRASTRFRAALRNNLPTQLASHGLAIAATLLAASADEIHQTFMPNRTGLFSDVIIDTCGGITLQLALFLILRGVAHWPTRPSNRVGINHAPSAQTQQPASIRRAA